MHSAETRTEGEEGTDGQTDTEQTETQKRKTGKKNGGYKRKAAENLCVNVPGFMS